MTVLTTHRLNLQVIIWSRVLNQWDRLHFLEYPYCTSNSLYWQVKRICKMTSRTLLEYLFWCAQQVLTPTQHTSIRKYSDYRSFVLYKKRFLWPKGLIRSFYTVFISWRRKFTYRTSSSNPILPMFSHIFPSPYCVENCLSSFTY